MGIYFLCWITIRSFRIWCDNSIILTTGIVAGKVVDVKTRFANSKADNRANNGTIRLVDNENNSLNLGEIDERGSKANNRVTRFIANKTNSWALVDTNEEDGRVNGRFARFITDRTNG